MRLLKYCLLLAFMVAESSHAQGYLNASFGINGGFGGYGGGGGGFGAGTMMGGYCPYPMGLAPGAYDESDEVYARKKRKSGADRELERAKREAELAKKNFQRHEDALKKRLSGKAATIVQEHLKYGPDKNQWISVCDPTASVNQPGGQAQGTEGRTTYRTDLCGKYGDGRAWYVTEWLEDGGEVNSSLCSVNVPQLASTKTNNDVGARIRCEYALKEWKPAYDKWQTAEAKVAEVTEKVERAKIDAEFGEGGDDDTEGENCMSGNCPSGRRRGSVSGLQMGLGAVMAGLGGYLVYRGGSKAIRSQKDMFTEMRESNAALGWPTYGPIPQTNPYWAAPAGLGMLSAGIAGMVPGGMGSGAYGCAGSPFGPGSAFYNPFAMNPMLGGGMYQPGFQNMLNGMMNPYGSPNMLPMMNGMMNPMMMGNPMMNMMNPMMSGMMSPNMLPMMNGMMNPMMMNGMGNPMFQMQHMQQVMAMQQMQQQVYAQQMQDYMYRQQTVYGLQQQMSQIYQQIMSISMGGSYYGGNSPSILPYPGGTGYGPGSSTGYPYGVGGGANYGPGTPVNGTGTGTTYTPGSPYYIPRYGR